jgi:flagellin-like protein
MGIGSIGPRTTRSSGSLVYDKFKAGGPARSIVRIRRRRPRGVSPIIATIFLVAMTLVSGVFLWSFRPKAPPQSTQIFYEVLEGPPEPTWGDGSDCMTVNMVQTCLELPSLDFVLTSSTKNTLPIADLDFYFFCNGTVYLSATLAQMAWVPGSNNMPGPNSPTLGTCGTFTPPAADWNRLAYYDQVNAGAANFVDGDTIVLYAHTFEPPNCPAPGPMGMCDDDYHGAPVWCYSVPNSCSIELIYAGPPAVVAMNVELYGLSY